MLIYVVCGSRDWPAPWFVTAKIIELIPHEALVITGGARGVDEHAHYEAIRLRRPTKRRFADWDRLGRRAGIIRNLEMLDEEPDGVLAFWYKRSPGTRHMIEESQRRGIDLYLFTEDDLRPDIAALDMGDIE